MTIETTPEAGKAITALADGDFLRMITAGGNSRRVPAAASFAMFQGGIVDVIENANGTAVRWESGVQIAWNTNIATVTMAQGDRQAGIWTLPAAFAAIPFRAITAQGDGAVSQSNMTYAVGAEWATFTDGLTVVRWAVEKVGQFSMNTRITGFVAGFWK